MRLYKPVKVVGQRFDQTKVVVVPNQSMTLKEIIRRFVRKESLPVHQEGIYEDRMGDLEKIANEDIFDKHERASALKSKLKKQQDRQSRAVESPLPTPAPSGAVTGSVGSGQAPPPAPPVSGG